MAADPTSRRDFLRRAGLAGMAWVAPAMSRVPVAQAASPTKRCRGYGTICQDDGAPCSTGCNSGAGGFCFDTRGDDQHPFCGANDSCSNLQTCVKRCPKGYRCSWHNGCTPDGCSNEGSGVCLKVCHKGSEPGGRRPRVPRGTTAAVRR